MTRHSPDVFDRARHHVYQALARMQIQDVEPTAENLAIWMLWASRQNEQVYARLEKMMQEGAELDPATNREIFQSAFGTATDSQSFTDLGNQIAGHMQDVLPKLAQGSADQATYRKALTNLSQDLVEATSPQAVMELVANLVAHTQQMQEKSQVLEIDLNTSSIELERLRAELNEAQRAANTDKLTGLINRGCFDTTLGNCVAAARRSGRPLSLLFVDVDHFKSVNDAFGHAVGDQILSLLGKFLMKTVSDKDVPARYGGEEFAVILPGSDLTAAAVLAEKIRHTFASYNFNLHKNGRTRNAITLSIGAATLGEHDSIDVFLRRADSATYTAKDRGRNQVVTERQLAKDVA